MQSILYLGGMNVQRDSGAHVGVSLDDRGGCKTAHEPVMGHVGKTPQLLV